MTTVIAVLALLAALAALGVAVVALRTGQRRREVAEETLADVPTDVQGLREEVAGLQLDLASSLRNLTVIRYDAFGDVGGKLSWTAAILDDHGSGLMLTSIQGRTEGRTYAKSVNEWACEQPLSTEEAEALTTARGRS